MRVEQKAELRCLLPRGLLNHGFFPPCPPEEEKCKDTNTSSRVSSFSWSGQRKIPSYINKLVFPEDFLTALRTLAMKEDELYQAASLLEEVLLSILPSLFQKLCSVVFLFCLSEVIFLHKNMILTYFSG